MVESPRSSSDDPDEGAAPTASFRITFGLHDTAPRAWDGELLPGLGQGLRVEADRFRAHDYADVDFSPAGMTTRPRGEAAFPNDYLRNRLAWVASTRAASLHRPTTEWHVRTEPPKPVIQSPSILVHLERGVPETPIRLQTAGGTFAFVPDEVGPFQPTFFLEGAVRVDRVPPVTAVDPDGAGQQDFPSVLATGSGELWVAWQEFDDESDSVKVRRWAAGVWEPTSVLVENADVFHTALGRDAHGRVWAVWSMQRDGRWNLYGRACVGTTWSPLERLTDHPGADVYHRLTTDSGGRLWLVWQRTVDGLGQIVAKNFDGRTWSPEEQISEGPSAGGNNWWPAVAAGPEGSLAVAWDGYSAGSYDVFLRRLEGGTWGEVRTVAGTARFEAHPTVAIDGSSRVWLAWDESGADWGKDTGFLVDRKGTQLHESRRVRVACLDGERWQTPAGELAGVLGEGAFWELPHLEIDREGGPWLFVRQLVMRQPDTPLEGPIDLALWEIQVTRYQGSAWTPPTYLPRSAGRNEMLPATTVAANGTVWAAWATDWRDTRSYLPHQHHVELAALGRPAPAGPPLLKPYVVEPAPLVAFHAREREQVARIRGYRVQSAGRSYGIYRGDLHRHTDISLDGANDGSLLDAYRYARDAAALDFLGVSDHTDGVDDLYAWWRTQKIADVFQAPGSFVAFYGYERSVEFPNGHRNVFFARRGARITPISGGESAGFEGAETLYWYLRRNDGFSIPHTTGRTSGTDWRDNDARVETLVELYQGMRDSYEAPGAPRPKRLWDASFDSSGPTPRASSSETSPSFRRAGFVSQALAKGYRLGFIASSDHISTHISYACLIAETLSPESLLEAVRARRAYAATDNIVLDVRFQGSDGEHLMGDEFASATPVRIRARIIGSAAIRQIDVIKDGDIVHTVRPGTEEAEFEFVDPDAAGGRPESYYYVRVVQSDGEMAWGSPAWVTYRASSAVPARGSGSVRRSSSSSCSR